LRRPEVSATTALFLDLDGTLIEIAPTPEGVTVPVGLVSLLADLSLRLGGAVAIVTGRPIADVDRLLAPLAPIGAGVHGAEMRTTPAGRVELRAQAVDAAIADAVRRLASREPGTIVELKTASIAVHYRANPSAGPRIEAALLRLLDGGPEHLILSHGRKVFEIVPRHVSKGAALADLMSLPAFRGRKPIMIGDDVTDQSAFAMAEHLGGVGLKVAGGQFAAAEADFASPEEVRAWLATMKGSIAS
jgi:trehalose 6-phosphate phosphatase